MKLILIRHGETTENKNGVIQGQLPGELSKKGIRQAKEASLKLKDKCIDYIYSSDLRRAKDTLKEIIKYHKNTPVKFTKELRERDLNEFEGKKTTEIRWKKCDFFKLSIRPRGGETIEELYLRAKKFITKTSKKHPSKTILVVGHQGINQMIMDVVGDKKPIVMESVGGLGNAEINTFEI